MLCGGACLASDLGGCGMPKVTHMAAVGLGIFNFSFSCKLYRKMVERMKLDNDYL